VLISSFALATPNRSRLTICTRLRNAGGTRGTAFTILAARRLVVVIALRVRTNSNVLGACRTPGLGAQRRARRTLALGSLRGGRAVTCNPSARR